MTGMGAHVAVVEVDPVRALEALMDGFQVMTDTRGGALGRPVRDRHRQRQRLPARALRARCATARSWPTRGHFDAELDLPALREMAEGHVREVRENVQEFDLGGKRLNLIAEGRLVNLGAAEGHPAAVMDMSFANQALSAEYVALHHAELEPSVYVVPEAIDREVARLKLAALGIELDADDAGAGAVRLAPGSTGPDRRSPRRARGHRVWAGRAVAATGRGATPVPRWLPRRRAVSRRASLGSRRDPDDQHRRRAPSTCSRPSR